MNALYGYNTSKIMRYKDGLKWMGQEPYAMLDEGATAKAKRMLAQYKGAGITLSAEKLVNRLRMDGVAGIKLYH